MPSLRHRLLLLLLTLFAAAWALLAVLSYSAVRHEVEKQFDAELSQSARVLLGLTRHELQEDSSDSGVAPGLIGGQAHPYEERIAFQIWQDGDLLLRSANSPPTPMSPSDGFHDREIDGATWRTFALTDKAIMVTINVGERYEVRNELVYDILGTTLLPVVLALPLLAVLIWSGISAGLAPLGRMVGEIGRRTPSALEPLAMRDVPEEIQPLAKELNGLLGRLRGALESERRFTSNAAHELRTPLAALRAQAQVAQRATVETERSQALDQLIRGVDRATRLVEQMLQLARLDPESAARQYREVVLADVVAEAVAGLASRAIERRIDLGVTETNRATLRGDAALLGVLVRNLVDNAIQHSQENARVDVAIDSAPEVVTLTVTDSGPGIPVEERPRVLERFYRMRDTRASGTGLGLSIVQKIAELHAATVTFEDAPHPPGLRVCVRFPRPHDVTETDT